MSNTTHYDYPWLTELTEPQRVAVLHKEGPLLILAGPGSGKTRVVTRRAANLAATVARPSQILAITFTNKAAREMRERIEAQGTARGMSICTFHAFCARLLREIHEQVRLPMNFSILDTDDRRKVIKRAVEECDLSSANWRPAAVEAVIGEAKTDMLNATEFAEQEIDWRHRTIAKIYQRYEQILIETGSVDFDDLLMKVARQLMADSSLAQSLEDRYRFVLVDEYQDTNLAQYTIARLITRQHSNLCVTGDPDQSVYGWRGANIENILSFERDYPSAQVVRLEQNFRSTKYILAAADSLIACNTQRKEKSLWTDNDDGAAVCVVECESGDDEAELVAKYIAEQISDGVDPSEIAVLYRINSLSRVIEESLMRQGIRYQIARGVEFYNRKEIKDTLAYLRILINPADEVAMMRIINTPTRGIGATTIERILVYARDHGCRVREAINREACITTLGRSAAKVKYFAQLLESLSVIVTMAPAAALSFLIKQSGLQAMYKSEERADDSPARNLDELVNAAATFQETQPEATLVDWLEFTALVNDVDAVSDDVGQVTLMTLHAAKGLEFSVVYILGLEDGLLPFYRDEDVCADVEEERRLLFVGMTRAKSKLTLLRARYRMLRGMTLRTVLSHFLDELPRNELEWSRPEPSSGRRRNEPDVGQLPNDIEEWEQGTLVRHPLHGIGQIMGLQRGHRRTHVDVLFKDGSRRGWILEFAPLERVDFYDMD